MRRAHGEAMERPGFLAAGPAQGWVRDSPDMGLARRLALLTAVIAVALVLGATEVALRWSERSRLDDRRRESVELATSWSEYLSRVAPQGERDAITQALIGLAEPAPEPLQRSHVRLGERPARAHRVQRYERAGGTDTQRLAGDGEPPAPGVVRQGGRAGVERGDADGRAGKSVRRVPRQRLHRYAAWLGTTGAAARLCAGAGRGAAGVRSGGVPHVDLGRWSAEHARRRDGRRPRGRGQRAGSAGDRARGVPPAHAAVQRAPRGAHHAAAGKRGARRAPGTGGARPEPRSAGAAGGDGHRLCP